MNDEEKKQEIKNIYKNFLSRLSILKNKQMSIIEKYIKKVEQKKIDNIKKSIK